MSEPGLGLPPEPFQLLLQSGVIGEAGWQTHWCQLLGQTRPGRVLMVLDVVLVVLEVVLQLLLLQLLLLQLLLLQLRVL